MAAEAGGVEESQGWLIDLGTALIVTMMEWRCGWGDGEGVRLERGAQPLQALAVHVPVDTVNARSFRVQTARAQSQSVAAARGEFSLRIKSKGFKCCASPSSWE